jgi:hypothetical protein
MKTARTFAALVLAAATNIVPARADAPHDPIGFDPLTEPQDIMSPDFVPDFLKSPPKPEVTPEEEAALQEAQKKVEDNKDWLLRGYEQQLESRQTVTDGDTVPQNTNLLAVLSANKDLARAANITPIDLDAAPELNPLTGEDGKKPKVDLRSDPMLDPLASADEKTAPLFTPLIVPLDAPASAPAHTPYALPSPISSTIFSPISFDLAPSETAEDDAAQSVTPADPGAMDFPGMTAAESNPAMREALDLPNDQEPGALPPEDKVHHDLGLELPEGSNSEQLQKLQSSALNVPSQPLIRRATPLVVNPLPAKPAIYSEPPMTVPSPLRNHLADPYDILR